MLKENQSPVALETQSPAVKGPSSALQECLEVVFCPNCGGQQVEEVFAACYAHDLSQEKLIEVYCSSSDVKLMDRLVKCQTCDLKYLTPRIRHDIIMKSYSDARDTVFTTQNPERIATFSRSLKWVLQKIEVRPSRAVRVLDVGCAGGAFPKAAHDLGLDVVGVEPSRYLAQAAAKMYNLDIRSGFLEEQNFADASFDIVTLWDVIEHLVEPKKVLAEILRILKPGGTLVVNYPDAESFAARLLGRSWPFYLSVHLIYFSPKTITQFLESAGYEVQVIRPFFQTLKLGYIFKRAAAYFPVFGLLESLVAGIGLGNVPVRYNMGQTIVIARKK